MFTLLFALVSTPIPADYSPQDFLEDELSVATYAHEPRMEVEWNTVSGGPEVLMCE